MTTNDKLETAVFIAIALWVIYGIACYVFDACRGSKKSGDPAARRGGSPILVNVLVSAAVSLSISLGLPVYLPGRLQLTPETPVQGIMIDVALVFIIALVLLAIFQTTQVIRRELNAALWIFNSALAFAIGFFIVSIALETLQPDFAATQGVILKILGGFLLLTLAQIIIAGKAGNGGRSVLAFLLNSALAAAIYFFVTSSYYQGVEALLGDQWALLIVSVIIAYLMSLFSALTFVRPAR